jgi:hypothetical protein
MPRFITRLRWPAGSLRLYVFERAEDGAALGHGSQYVEQVACGVGKAGQAASPQLHGQSLGLLNRFQVVFADKDLSGPCKAACIQWANAIFGHYIAHAANVATRIVFGKPCRRRACSSAPMISIVVSDRYPRINAAAAVTIGRHPRTAAAAPGHQGPNPSAAAFVQGGSPRPRAR